MATEQTLSIIKPDGVERDLVGTIVSRFEEEGLTPVAMRMVHLSEAEAEGFYAVHSDKPFFDSLVEFMTRSPIVVMVLEGDDAIAKNRDIMGATDPADADDGTLRAEFAGGIEENTVHGSDSPENAAKEIKYFFSDVQIFGGEA